MLQGFGWGVWQLKNAVSTKQLLDAVEFGGVMKHAKPFEFALAGHIEVSCFIKTEQYGNKLAKDQLDIPFPLFYQ